MKNLKWISKIFTIVLLSIVIIGCGGTSFDTATKTDNNTTENNTTDTVAPTVPILISPENNITIFDNNISLEISGEVNATIYLDGISTGVDINESGRGSIVINLDDNKSYEYNITLQDSTQNESDPLLFTITKLSAPTLVSPDNNTTTFLNTITVQLKGGANTRVYLDGEDTGVDLNSSGEGEITIPLSSFATSTYIITLQDSYENNSSELLFTITKEYDTEAAKQIKAIEIGYIKDANISTVDDQNPVYSDSNNTYTFLNFPNYGLTLMGGTVKDLNLSLDINMTTPVGTVISPITTLIDKDSNLQNIFATILGIGSGAENFSKDYLATNDLNFTKIAAISYVALKYPTITPTFLTQTSTNADIKTIELYGSKLSTVITSSDLNVIQKYFSNKFITEVIAFDKNTTQMASELKAIRYAMDENITLLPKRTLLKTNQTICYDKANPSNPIVCSDSNGSGDGKDLFGETRNFERNSSLNIVTDNTSKLQWQDDNISINTPRSWSSANQYCQDLNISGLDDWYLPSIEQLNSIVDRNSTDTSNLVDSIFTQRGQTVYWSSTLYKPITDNYRTVLFNVGITAYNSIGSTLYVRCVRDLD